MSRPNSRYFASVIKKLTQAKKSEQIVIDTDFKAALRQNILLGLPEINKEVAPSILESEVTPDVNNIPVGLDERDSKFWDFFNKFKYHFALVPSLMLLVLVAIQATKLPVQIKTQVMVPTSQQSTAVSGEQSLPQANADLSADVFEQSSQIKTFPGYLALPSSLREKLQQGSAGNVSAGSSESVEIPNDSNLSNSRAVQQSQAPGQVNLNVTPNDSIYAQPVNHQPAYINPSWSIPNTSPVQNSQPVTVAPAFAPTPAPVLYQPVQPNNTNQSVPVQITPAKSQNVQLGPSGLSYPVLYNSNISNDEKLSFEQTVIGPLSGEKPVSYVSVNQVNNAMNVKIFFLDGSSKTVTLKKDPAGPVWNLVLPNDLVNIPPSQTVSVPPFMPIAAPTQQIIQQSPAVYLPVDLGVAPAPAPAPVASSPAVYVPVAPAVSVPAASVPAVKLTPVFNYTYKR